jgi:hypothetical protein
MQSAALFDRVMKIALFCSVFLCVSHAHAQIQIDLKFPRLQFIAYEPVTATLGITNLAGRDIDLHDADGQSWFGFEVTRAEGQPVGPLTTATAQPPLKIEAGKRVTQKINLTTLYPVYDFGVYHVRAHIYFPDLGKYFYSQAKVFEVTDARPIWQQTVGMPGDTAGPGKVRTYSLLSNRFPNHTSLYVRVADKDTGIVYATYSLGRVIAFDEPQVQLDQANQLHVLHCAGPRSWSYSVVGLNGELVSHSSYAETRTRPRLIHAADGAVSVRGGIIEAPVAATSKAGPKLSDRPPPEPPR